jgi:hypothetical protein
VGIYPTELISTGNLTAIIVVIGYKLNTFGFLAGDALEKETNEEAVGNYDLRNQKSATEWFTSILLRLAGILIISLFDERVLERILYMPRRCTVFNNRIQIVRTILPETIHEL